MAELGAGLRELGRRDRAVLRLPARQEGGDGLLAKPRRRRTGEPRRHAESSPLGGAPDLVTELRVHRDTHLVDLHPKNPTAGVPTPVVSAWPYDAAMTTPRKPAHVVR